MASSMTGLGIGEAQFNSTTITVELKSVNNRYLEVSCRLPSFLSYYEQQVRDIIRNGVERGKIYTTITVKGDPGGISGIRINEKIVGSIHDLLNRLRNVAGIREKLRLDHYMRFSEIFESYSEPENADLTWSHVKKALQDALDALKEMRWKEGEILLKDIAERIQSLEKHLDTIESIARDNVSEEYKKLTERIERLTQDHNIDQDRLHAEIALLADKMDITEECVRLRSHNQIFLNTLEKNEVVGKKLNFLLQEMNREANTISSKTIHVEISHTVVEMKEEIEKIREQVQNLE
jgi:uncharacterized protein (TIGR00255 family)